MHGRNLIYVASMSGLLTAIEKDTGDIVWQINIGAPLGSAPVLVGGRIYVGSDDGNLYVYGRS